MYRDDVCAVCGESLPPDHFYCREHAATVDARLHEIGTLLARVSGDARRLAALLGEVAEETWDYLAEREPDDPAWPLAPAVELRVLPEDVDVDVDSEPGFVRVALRTPLPAVLDALATQLGGDEIARLAAACAHADGANATH